MNIQSSNAVQASLSAAQSQPSSETQGALQLTMLKKALQNQEQQASALMKQLGLGQVVDMRV